MDRGKGKNAIWRVWEEEKLSDVVPFLERLDLILKNFDNNFFPWMSLSFFAILFFSAIVSQE